MSNRTRKFLNKKIFNRPTKLTKKTLSILKETIPIPTQLNRQKTESKQTQKQQAKIFQLLHRN